jgi:hypothetical protein
MTRYVMIAAKFEATGAALPPSELESGLIHRPNPTLATPKEVTPLPATR